MSRLFLMCKRELFDGRDVWAMSEASIIENHFYHYQFENPLNENFTFFEDREELISLCSSTPHILLFRDANFTYVVKRIGEEFFITRTHTIITNPPFAFLSVITYDEKWRIYLGGRSDNFKSFGGKEMAFRFIVENLL